MNYSHTSVGCAAVDAGFMDGCPPRDGTEVAVSVSDQGRGTAADQLPRRFRKCAGPDGGDAGRSHAGTGGGPVTESSETRTGMTVTAWTPPAVVRLHGDSMGPTLPDGCPIRSPRNRTSLYSPPDLA